MKQVSKEMIEDLEDNRVSKQEERKNWIPDNQVTECSRCDKPFTFFFRKHHCRVCKSIFCKNCASERTVDEGGSKSC